MKALIVFSLLWTIEAAAGPSYQIAYHADCKGAGFDLKPVSLTWRGSFDVINGKLPKDSGPTSFLLARDGDAAVIFNLDSAGQKLFRDTEAGVSFFGIFDDVHLSAPHQRVYVFIRYGSVSSVFWYLSAAANRPQHKDAFLKELNNLTFDFQAIAEDDPNGVLSVRLKCSFDSSKVPARL